jgi:prolyl-tRNA synthetase
LGEKYSAPLGAVFQDEQRRQAPMLMGCYGLGITRLLSAVAETRSDERGIIWPTSLAPFEAVILQLDDRSTRQTEVSELLYSRLTEAGVDVLQDDREERAGVKFRDAELIGIPLQVIVGKVTEREGRVQVAERGAEEKKDLTPQEAVEWVTAKVSGP